MHKSWRATSLISAASFGPLAILTFLVLRTFVNQGAAPAEQLFSGIYEIAWAIIFGFMLSTLVCYLLATDQKLFSVLLAWALMAAQLALLVALVTFLG